MKQYGFIFLLGFWDGKPPLILVARFARTNVADCQVEVSLTFAEE
jgi:hypothetical protein